MRTILISFYSLRTALGLALAVTLAGGEVRGQGTPLETARRLADVAAIALDEYALGVTDGRVVSAAELEEAELFLAEARRLVGELPAAIGGAIAARVDQLVAGVAARRPVAELRATLDAVRQRLEADLGAALDPPPRGTPSLRNAASAYASLCSTCHGPAGRGDGPLAPGLEPPPADLTSPDLRNSSPLDFYRKINVGVAATAMPGFSERLSDEERWALALYASNLRYTDREREAGAAVLRGACPGCLVWLASFAEAASLTDDSLSAILAGELGRSPGDSLVRAAVAYARTAGAQEELGGDLVLNATRVVERARVAAGRAVELAERGDRDAATRQALDAYLVFEGIESGVRARNPGVARRVERAFADLRAATAAGDVGGARTALGDIEQSLERSLGELRAASSPALLFSQSLVIMLREGFEAILIIGALVAFLTRAGATERKREIGWGVAAALVASLATAAVYGFFFQSAVASQELVEGVTMLVAALVLFWVSYWLVSKIELKKWQAFVSSRMTHALSSGRALALAAVAFLAVYREGFETVLFYAALIASAGRVPGAGVAVGAGIVVGLGALAIVYVLMQRYGSRIPLKPFFAVTSALLYVMAFSFVGQGIAELQEAGYVPTTPLRWLPTLPALGIFPTVESFALQAVLIVALLGAVAWVFWLEPRLRRAW